MKSIRIAFAVTLAALLGACATPPAEVVPFTPPPYGAPFYLDVASVEVVREPGPQSMRRPGEPFPMDLGEFIDRWAAQRLRATGSTGRARVVIEKAMVTENFQRETDYRTQSFHRYRLYDGILEVRIDLTDTATQRMGFARGNARRTATAPETATLGEREDTGWRLGEDLLADLNDMLDVNIRKHLGQFMR